MKLGINLLALACLSMSAIAWAQKADGYAYQQNDNFPPGIYEAVEDAKVYFDIDKKSVEKKALIKKGARISVYSAGYHSAQPASIDWFNLGEGQECNGKLLPWDKLGWIGVLKQDFKRVESLPKPSKRNGLITNCVSMAPEVSASGAATQLLLIKAVTQSTPDKGIRSRSPVEVTGKIESGHDAAGGNFWINGGKKRQYTIGYIWDFDDATQAELGKIADTGTIVTVKGTLKVWKDGSASLDNADPISIFK